MSTDYPRTIAIHRPPSLSGVGVETNYVAQTSDKETIIVTGIAASIQARPLYGHTKEIPLPSDICISILWDVQIAAGGVADGLVRNRDIVIDDLGNRFQVTAVYVNSVGINFIVEQMES